MDTIIFTFVTLACLFAAGWLTIDVENSTNADEHVAIVTVKLMGVILAIGCACLSAWLVLNSLHPV